MADREEPARLLLLVVVLVELEGRWITSSSSSSSVRVGVKGWVRGISDGRSFDLAEEC